jgi:hypothetical protein
MKNSNSLDFSGFNEPEPLYEGDLYGAPGKYWTEIDWSRTRSDSQYCKAVIKRFERTAYLHRCTINNQHELYDETMISEAERDLPYVRDCLHKLKLLLKEIE